MNGTTWQRVVRVAVNLIANPGMVPRYLRNLPLTGRQPLDVGLPWYSFERISGRFRETFNGGTINTKSTCVADV